MRTRAVSTLLVFAGLSLAAAPLAAQTGAVGGTVTQSGTNQPLVGVIVSIQGTNIRGVTSTRGTYLIENVPVGAQTMIFRWLGYKPVQVEVSIAAGATASANATMEQLPIQLSELTVTGASRVPERAVEAPAAFSIVEPRVLQATGITGQAPMALREVPGVDIVQSGVNDFNVNARGFNSTLNRRVLVLQDGRDLAIAFLGAQEWTAMPVPTDEFSKMELVRGPGSALYGANAFFGVLNITTPTAREVVGTKLTIGGGLLEPRRQNGESFSGTSLRADARHAGTLWQGKLGYRFNAGFNQSDSWSQSRTSADCLDMRREYGEVVDDQTAHPIPPSCEARPLNGQTRDAAGVVTGDPDPTQSIYGAARLDYYLPSGSVISAESGVARVENELFVTGIGRVQVTEAWRPYARAAWASPGFNVMAYWNARNGGLLKSGSKQHALSSGALLQENSNIFHIEAQDIESFANDKAQLVFGGSLRNYRVDTKGTLMLPADDDRSDFFYATFGQLEYRLTSMLTAVAAARVDIGSLIDPQLSPKFAIVASPNPRHSVRFTVNRAFQMPNYSEFYLAAPADRPADLTALEAGLRASPLGPALAGVPNGRLFGSTVTGSMASSSMVPVVARGNRNLDVETTLGLETGYRGDLSDKIYVTLDVYYNRIRNFVTDLLPGVNPLFPYWTAPTQVPAPFRAALVDAVRTNLSAASPTAGAGLTREDGTTKVVVSYTNAGKVTQYGAELGAGIQLTRALRSDATLTLFDYEVDEAEQQEGDLLLANTPSAKGTLSLSFADRALSASALVRAVKGYDWAAGVFAGYLEPSVTVDANVGYDLNNNLKLFVAGTNILDQRRFTIYGGSVNGRRILGGVTTRF